MTYESLNKYYSQFKLVAIGKANISLCVILNFMLHLNE